VTDTEHELLDCRIVINAVDHASTAERQAASGIVARTTREKLSDHESVVFEENETMRGDFGHPAILHPSDFYRYVNRRDAGPADGSIHSYHCVATRFHALGLEK
jgi:hypothetical protein